MIPVESPYEEFDHGTYGRCSEYQYFAHEGLRRGLARGGDNLILSALTTSLRLARRCPGPLRIWAAFESMGGPASLCFFFGWLCPQFKGGAAAARIGGATRTAV